MLMAICSNTSKTAKIIKEEQPLRNIFDEVCRQSATTADTVAFADLESSLYKRRRTALPGLGLHVRHRLVTTRRRRQAGSRLREHRPSTVAMCVDK